jgi:hypothetical protein
MARSSYFTFYETVPLRAVHIPLGVVWLGHVVPLHLEGEVEVGGGVRVRRLGTAPLLVTRHPARQVHCKKRFAIFLSPAGMSLTKYSLAGNNLIIPAQGEFSK